jgi:hypothetical protein
MSSLETELTKALKYITSRWRIQNNFRDVITKYIYNTDTIDELISKSKKCSELYNIDYNDIFNYALNRWFNKSVSLYAEDIFTSYDIVEDEVDIYNKEIDFYIKWIPFDLKVSVFPKWYSNDIEYAMNNKEDIIGRLYKNCSKEKRLHNGNKLFIMCYSEDWNHNKVKWDLEKIRNEIDKYIKNYNEDDLIIVWNSLSDIIFIKS